MTISHPAVLAAVGVVVWVCLALCVAIAVGRTIRERHRHADDRRGPFIDPVAGAHPERVGTRLDVKL